MAINFANNSGAPSKIAMQKIDLGLFLQLIREGDIVIIDMRSVQDYEHFHIKDALGLYSQKTENEKEKFREKLNTTRYIILYSNEGIEGKMQQYAETLFSQGRNNVFIYAGGFNEWSAAGLPVERID